MAYREVINYEWSFIAAQTDVQLLAIGATQRFVATYCQIICANSNTVDVAVRLGLTTAATLPTLTDNSATPTQGMILSHGGVAKGGGAVVTNGGAAICRGAVDADLRMTCSVPTGGSLRVILQGEILENQ